MVIITKVKFLLKIRNFEKLKSEGKIDKATRLSKH